MKKIKVVAAIIKDGDKIFIAQRLKGEFAQMWEFPGGKVELGEDNETALKREIKEELNIDINIDSYLMKVEYSYPSFNLDMDCYLCSLSSYDLNLNDHTAYQWVKIDLNLKKINWIPADLVIIERLLANKSTVL